MFGGFLANALWPDAKSESRPVSARIDGAYAPTKFGSDNRLEVSARSQKNSREKLPGQNRQRSDPIRGEWVWRALGGGSAKEIDIHLRRTGFHGGQQSVVRKVTIALA